MKQSGNQNPSGAGGDMGGIRGNSSSKRAPTKHNFIEDEDSAFRYYDKPGSTNQPGAMKVTKSPTKHKKEVQKSSTKHKPHLAPGKPKNIKDHSAIRYYGDESMMSRARKQAPQQPGVCQQATTKARASTRKGLQEDDDDTAPAIPMSSSQRGSPRRHEPTNNAAGAKHYGSSGYRNVGMAAASHGEGSAYGRPRPTKSVADTKKHYGSSGHRNTGMAAASHGKDMAYGHQEPTQSMTGAKHYGSSGHGNFGMAAANRDEGMMYGADQTASERKGQAGGSAVRDNVSYLDTSTNMSDQSNAPPPIGAVPVPGPFASQDDTSYMDTNTVMSTPSTVVAQPIEGEVMTDDARQQLREELRQEVQAQLDRRMVRGTAIAEARNEEEEEPPFWTKKRKWGAIGLVVIAVVAALAVGLSVGLNNDSDGGTDSVTQGGAPTVTPAGTPTGIPMSPPDSTRPPSPVTPTGAPPPSVAGSWSPIGQTFVGNRQAELIGRWTSLSADGDIVAIGSIFVNDNGSGVVRVYRRNRSTNQWDQMGSDINGVAPDDGFGDAVALDAAGTTLAVGSPDYTNPTTGLFETGLVRVYEYNGSEWQQLGEELIGEGANDGFGIAVTISKDGSIVAIGAIGNDENGSNAGHVRVYQWSGSAWQQMGSSLLGEEESLFGIAVEVSGDGLTLAVGAIEIFQNSTGYAQVFTFNGTDWTQKGIDLSGDSDLDFFGLSVSLSSDGDTVCAGGPFGGEDDRGYVKAFQWDGSKWASMGMPLFGASNEDHFGYAVALSDNGQTLVVGAPDAHSNGGGFSGHVRSFSYDGSDWQPKGFTLESDEFGSDFGWTLSTSADANVVAVGDRRNNVDTGEEERDGRVLVSEQVTESMPTPTVAPAP